MPRVEPPRSAWHRGGMSRRQPHLRLGPAAPSRRGLGVVVGLLLTLLVGCKAPPAERAERWVEKVSHAVTEAAEALRAQRGDAEALARRAASVSAAARAELPALVAALDDAAHARAIAALQKAYPQLRRAIASCMGSRLAGTLDAEARHAAPLRDALPAALVAATRFDAAVTVSGVLEVGEVLADLAALGAPGALGGPSVSKAADSPAELLRWARFARGSRAFRRVYAANEGLGPYYNDVACAGCHSTPTLGGWGGVEHGAGFRVSDETEREIMGAPRHRIDGTPALPLPAGATIAVRRAPPLYGIGLFDAVPEAEIRRVAAGNSKRPDGVRGVANLRVGQLARFGAKAHELSTRFFVAAALKDEMGITSPGHRCENQLGDEDGASDPEIGSEAFEDLVFFVENLAPPPPRQQDARARAGAATFSEIGCDGCHRPVLGSLEGAYTDLLVHRMGAALDNGMPEQNADGDAWRTAPLWGLRFRPKLLHDDSAATPDAAIRKHGGEAAQAKTRYKALSATQRAALLAFLGTL